MRSCKTRSIISTGPVEYSVYLFIPKGKRYDYLPLASGMSHDEASSLLMMLDYERENSKPETLGSKVLYGICPPENFLILEKFVLESCQS